MTLEAAKMLGKDGVFAGLAECYLSVDGTRYNFMQAKNVEATATKNKVKLPILGQVNKANKAGGVEYKGKANFYYNTSLFRKLMKKYQDSGEDIYFDMVITNEDATSSVGKQTVILKNCNLDNAIIAKFDAGGDILEDSFDFTFDSFEMPDEFTQLDGMVS